MSNLKQCYIMGLPNAGKTTYLAALWHSLNSPLMKNKIKLNIMGDSTYLADISKKWVNVEKLDRTKLGYEKMELVIEIIDENKDIFNLRFQDLSGETFQNQYEKREISNDLVEYIRSADGILMFINVADVVRTTLISEVSSGLNSLNCENNQGEESHITRDPIADDPIQVQIIELLQFMEFIRRERTFNLGIVLSAWDLITSLGRKLTPEEYVKQNMNMLWQFIQSKGDTIKTSFWGISAQGGRLEDEDKLLNIEEPMERIQVENNCGESCNDITLPIYHVVGE